MPQESLQTASCRSLWPGRMRSTRTLSRATSWTPTGTSLTRTSWASYGPRSSASRWVGRETDSSGQVTRRNTVWCWFISVPVGQEHRETYLLVSCWSCLYSFTKLVYKQTNILLILDQIKEDPITLSIYVIAARDELNLNFSTLLTIQLSSSSLISSTSRSHFR